MATGGSRAVSRPLRIVLLVLALPAAAVGYTLAASFLSGLPIPAGARDLAVLFLPLLVGGLCAVPFLIPFFDHLATQALADRPGGPGAPPRDDSREG